MAAEAHRGPKVEFALGSEVSPGHFFKSSFARSFVSAAALTKSLDLEPTTPPEGNLGDVSFASRVEAIEASRSASGNGNFYSLANLMGVAEGAKSSVWSGAEVAAAIGQSLVQPTTTEELDELERLRKQCQSLTEEKQRLQASLSSQPAHVQVIDNVCLQSQVDTLQWQLKQSEANRQMYRSMMEQVVRFLERARRSLDIIHERSSSKSPSKSSGGGGGGSSGGCVAKDKSRVPRSRSVHAVQLADQLDSPGCGGLSTSMSCASSTTSSSSSASSSSRFSRAKSVAQIASAAGGGVGGSGGGGPGGLRDFTWSVLRRNEPGQQCAPPRIGSPAPPHVASLGELDVNGTRGEGLGYRRPKQSGLDPDDVPPEKLSQEAFRLMRTVQSLLVMRDPDLARLSTAQDLDHHQHHRQHHHHRHEHHQHHHPDASQLSLQTSFANSTLLADASTTPTTSGCSSSDRGTDASTDDESNRTLFGSDISDDLKLAAVKGALSTSSQQTLVPAGGAAAAAATAGPRTRQSIGAASLDSVGSRNDEDEEGPRLGTIGEPRAQQQHQQPVAQAGGKYAQMPSSSTPHGRRIKKMDRRELHFKSLRDWALGSSSGSVASRPKPAPSVSSAEDESGFSSMSSFQEVGLPHAGAAVATTTTTAAAAVNPAAKGGGCHTEVGLPEVPLEKIRHRRWSSTPAEFKALFKRHSGSYGSGAQANAESLSVWV